MAQVLSIVEQIHFRALETTARFRKSETELLEVVQAAEEHLVYLRRGHSSLFRYLVSELGVSESMAYSLILVGRKAREVPALKERMADGSITLSKARRICAVVDAENQNEWLDKASRLTSRQLEREVVRVRPEEAVPERMTCTAVGRIQLEVGLSEIQALQLRRAQDLLCQSRNRSVRLDETIGTLAREYLRRHDPLEKAKRYRVRKGAATATRVPSHGHAVKIDQKTDLVGKLGTCTVRSGRGQAVARRELIPAARLHEVNLRDQRKCQQPLADGTLCGETRWLDVHHIIPISEGGSNDLENLVTLCRAHHKLRHLGPGMN